MNDDEHYDDDEYYLDEDEEYEPLPYLQSLVEDNHFGLQDILRNSVDDPDREVRIYVAFKLAELFQDVQALPGLYEAISSGNRTLQRSAAEAIWQIGDTDSPGLIRALHFERGSVREAIAGALELVGWIPDDVNTEIAYHMATRNWQAIITIGAEAVPGLVSALNDPDGNVRRGVVWVLGQIGDARSTQWLIPMLDDTSGDMFGIGDRICDVAAEALLRIGTEDAILAVEQWRTNGSGAHPPSKQQEQ